MPLRKVDPVVHQFHHELHQKVASGQYKPQQIFYMREAHVFWKSVGQGYYFLEGEYSPWMEVERVQERMTMLLCTNMTGDCILEPLLFLQPKHLNSIRNDELFGMSGVQWRAFDKAVMTEEIFEHWFHECLAVKLKTFCVKKKIPFKTVLVYEPQTMRSASSGYKHINHTHIEMVAISDSVKMIKPVYETFVEGFRHNYAIKFNHQLNDYSKQNNKLKDDDFNEFIQLFVRGFKINDAAKLIELTIKELKAESIEKAWNTIYKSGEEYAQN